MSARMDAPVECACDELAAHHTIEMMLRALMAKQVDNPGPADHNQIQSGYRFVFETELAKIDALRAIATAKEQA